MRNKILLLLVAALLATGNAFGKKQPETFEVGINTFLLNGKPFIIKAAEVHYPRIPRPYWEHRIKMCKALGMNTVCLYVFWNFHEQKEGQYDFTGNADVAEFKVKEGSRITQKPIKDMGLPKGITIGGLIRNGEGMLVTGNTMILPGDHVVVFCLEKMIKKAEKFFN